MIYRGTKKYFKNISKCQKRR